MISQLHGTLIEATPSTAVVEAAGIGFELGISGTTSAALGQLGDEVRVYTRMQVREDACALYAFASKDERTMFDKLVAVSGVGPRLALAVLSYFTVPQLYATVMAEDAKGMEGVPGVGRKTAQRLILELKGAFSRDASLRGAVAAGPAQPQLSAAPAGSALDDARMALLAMGFTSQEADLALDGYDGSDLRVEALLGAALKRLGMDA